MVRFQSPPTRGTTCHRRVLRWLDHDDRKVSIPSNAGNYLPPRSLRTSVASMTSFNPLQRGENAKPLPRRRPHPGQLPLPWFQSPPTRGTTCHGEMDVPCERHYEVVSIPSNAGNYLPPSNAGNYLPLVTQPVAAYLAEEIVFQSPPTRGTTCHPTPSKPPVVRYPFQSPPTRGTTCHIEPGSLLSTTDGSFNPLQRGELPATWQIASWLYLESKTFQSPPTRGTTCHTRSGPAPRTPRGTVSIPSNAGNYLPNPPVRNPRAWRRGVSIPSNAGNYLPPAR